MDYEYIIQTEGLTKTYKKWYQRKGVYALNNLTLNVEPDQVFGFLGPNGAGKTTTIKLLLNLIMPTAGKGFIMGKPLGDVEVKKHIGFLSENPVFYGHMKAEGFLEFYGKTFGISRAELKKKIPELIELVGLKGKEHIKIRHYSKGMTQRIGLAQSMINDPDILFLDEPLSGLDPVGRKEVRDIIRRIHTVHKRTVFFSSHILEDVEQVCDSVCIMKAGELVVTGELDALLQLREMEFKVQEMTQDCRDALRGFADKIIDERDCTLVVVQDLNLGSEVEQILNEKGAKILDVVKRRDSLETFFMEQVGG